MAERERLEARLADLAGAVEWPATPDLRAAVRAGIGRAGGRASSRRRRLVLLLVAAAVVAALLGGAAAAASLGIRGATIQRVPRLPSPAPATPGPAGARLDLGQRYGSLAEAERVAGFRALAPAALGAPDEVYYRESPGVLTLVYRPRPGLPASTDPQVGALVMEAAASVGPRSFTKLAAGGTRVEPVTVNGGPGFWVSGAPHAFVIYEGLEDGGDRFRLAGDVLIWNQGGRVIRIESGLDEQRAMAIAGTVR